MERDRVIDGLKCLAKSDKVFCALVCPGFRVCADKVAKDALKLLVPRLLTIEEIMALPDDEVYTAPVCVETKYPVDKWDGGTYCKWLGARFVKEEYLGSNVYYNADTYGAIWRAWTGWLSEEQRNKAGWCT